MRSKPDGAWIADVSANSDIGILEWEHEWCFVKYRDQTGYAKTSWLYHICSLDPVNAPLRDNPCSVEGLLILQEEYFLQAGKYQGTTLPLGSTICARRSENGSFVVPVWRDTALIDDLSADWLPFTDVNSAAPGDIIGGFTTFYGDQQGKDMAEERAYNILVGCERIDHTILEPDEEFSFNAHCAPYHKSNGYMLAPNISKDGFGYGGGVCQVSTTLYNALLTTPLLISCWSVHSYYGVDYVPQSFDATVSSYSTDFRFVNTLSYPILIQASASDGVVSILISRTE